MNVPYRLIRELMFYEFEQGHNVAEQPKAFVVQKAKALLITVQ